MPPRRQFEDEEETSSGSEETSSEEEESEEEEQVKAKAPAKAPAKVPAIKSRTKFDDEEDDSDVVDDWEAEDSEAEREKAKKEAEAKAKAAAAAAANKKSKLQRIEDHKAANAARRAAEDDESSDEDEDDTEKRVRLKAAQRDADMRHAEDLFGNVEISREKSAPKTLVNVDPSDPTKMADLSELAFFRPTSKAGFEYLREKLVPLLASNAKKAQYALFLTEFTKQISKDLPSDQIKKVASALTTLSNEKMKEEKAAEKGGKKSKAAKTKATLVASRNIATKADVEAYDDGLEEDDFM